MDAPMYLLGMLIKLAVAATVFFAVVPFGLWLGRIVIIGNINEVTFEISG
jgi:hypothetical protein